MRDREGASFLLPLFSTIILDVRGDKEEVGLRFFLGLCVENVLLDFDLGRLHSASRRAIIIILKY